MVIKLFTSVALLYAAVTVNAQTSSDAPRTDAGCGLLKGDIFCFGGIRGNFTTSDATDTTMFMLDLSKNATMAELAGNWTLIHPNTNGVNVETRQNPQFAQISDTQIVFNGGFGGAADNMPLTDQTIVYDAESNSWSKYPAYTEGSFGQRQIYYGASAFVPEKGAIFYGGFEEHINASWSIDTSQNVTATIFGGISRVIGFVDATFFNSNQSATPWNVPTPQNNAPAVFSAFQTSVYSPYDQRVYYLGGTYQDTTVTGYQPAVFANWHPMSYALYYDVATNSWGNQSLGGAIIPTNRKSHTLTVIPNDPTKILLYGGESQDVVSSDFCFTLDLTSFTWTQNNFSIPSDGSDLLRSRHNAITVGNDSVFMVFGLTSTGQSTSRPLYFNISSPSSITYTSQYIAPAALVDTTTNSTTNSTTANPESPSNAGDNNKLSSGAIAGIVVGIVVVVIIAAIAIFFYLRKKRNEKKHQGANEVNRTGEQSLNHSQENIEVNWDEIEKNYTEVPPIDSGVIQKPDDGKTDTDSHTFIATHSDGSVGHVIQHQVNVSHTNIQTPATTTNTPYLVMKPDGGNQ